MEEQRSFDEKKELWARSSTFLDYEVSTNGRVRRSPESKSMPGQIMQRNLNRQNRLWVMLRNEYSQQVRIDIAELVAEAFLGHVPGETAIIFVERTNDPSANNLRVYGCESANPKPIEWVGYEEADPVSDMKRALGIKESAAELEQRALFEQALIDGSDPQRLKDIQEGA